MLLSQERVAEMSGLSLRTVQRLDAGHRVSYASLRALATTFRTDVDLLEREIYAMHRSSEEFVEIPRWVRILDDKLSVGGRRLSRRDFLVVEALNIVFAAMVFAASFLVSEHARAVAVRMVAIVPLLCCYLTAVAIRMHDRYRLWPGFQNALAETPRTWRSTMAEYAFLITTGTLGVVAAAWLFVG